MKLIKSQKAWRRFEAQVMKGQSSELSQPREFPCFVYLQVASFNYEEENAQFLYAFDLYQMQRSIGKAGR